MKHRETDLDTLGLSHNNKHPYINKSMKIILLGFLYIYYLFTAKYEGRYKSEKFYLT